MPYVEQLVLDQVSPPGNGDTTGATHTGTVTGVVCPCLTVRGGKELPTVQTCIKLLPSVGGQGPTFSKAAATRRWGWGWGGETTVSPVDGQMVGQVLELREQHPHCHREGCQHSRPAGVWPGGRGQPRLG